MPTPTRPLLYAKVKAEAKEKFDVWPSAYASGWLVQEYKRRGGTYMNPSMNEEWVHRDKHGTVTLIFDFLEWAPGYALISDLEVTSKRRGHGRRLVALALDEVCRRGVDGIIVPPRESIEADRFWTSHRHFVPIREPGYEEWLVWDAPNRNPDTGLTKWFGEDWIDLGRSIDGKGHIKKWVPCGRPDASQGKYPKCVPKAKAKKMKPKQRLSAVKRKRAAESLAPNGKGRAPIHVKTLNNPLGIDRDPLMRGTGMEELSDRLEEMHRLVHNEIDEDVVVSRMKTEKGYLRHVSRSIEGARRFYERDGVPYPGGLVQHLDSLVDCIRSGDIVKITEGVDAAYEALGQYQRNLQGGSLGAWGEGYDSPWEDEGVRKSMGTLSNYLEAQRRKAGRRAWDDVEDNPYRKEAKDRPHRKIAWVNGRIYTTGSPAKAMVFAEPQRSGFVIYEGYATGAQRQVDADVITSSEPQTIDYMMRWAWSELGNRDFTWDPDDVDAEENPRRRELYIKPNKSAVKIAKRALERRKKLPKSKRGGLDPMQAHEQGIGSGVLRARDIAAGKKINAYQVKAFFDRHRKNFVNANLKGLDWNDSKALQSWDLWGGEPLRKQVEKAVNKDKKNRKSNPKRIADMSNEELERHIAFLKSKLSAIKQSVDDGLASPLEMYELSEYIDDLRDMLRQRRRRRGNPYRKDKFQYEGVPAALQERFDHYGESAAPKEDLMAGWGEYEASKQPYTGDLITGGMAGIRRPEDFDPISLAKGTAVEMEHTDDPEMAKKIAMDHLSEDPDYYEYLEAMHRVMARGRRRRNPPYKMGYLGDRPRTEYDEGYDYLLRKRMGRQ